MTADNLVDLVRAAMREGKPVEISVALYERLETIASIDALYGDWIQFTHPGLDVTICVPVEKVNGLRVLPNV